MTWMRSTARAVLPPALYRGMRSISRRATSSTPSSAEVAGELKSPEWYDHMYGSSAHYSAHYTESIYYPIWTVIVDRITRLGADDVLDLGCGPGQFAALLQDRGIKRYCGLDFSRKSIELARDRCPAYHFEQVDISKPGVIESLGYDCVVSLEFLEHVDGDVAILERIDQDTRVFATVPNFESASHVRHFSNEDEVRDRYEGLFSEFRCDLVLLRQRGTALYLIDAVKA